MAKRSKKRDSQTKLQDLVIVTLAESAEQAREYEALLKNNSIPVVIKEHHEDTSNGIAVMVPEDRIDEAQIIIESQDAYDDFYDSTLLGEEFKEDFDVDDIEDFDPFDDGDF